MWSILFTIVAVLALICIWVMIYDSNRFVVRHHEFRDARIRRNCRAVVLADLHNKRYGKDNERLIEAVREAEPDMILVAYGANDWNSNTEAEFAENSRAFCMHLRQNYPKAKIFVLSPIWTSTREAKKHERWPFENLVAHLQALPAFVDNLVVIDGTDFVPYDQACFAEDRVHPNDVGFTYYARNLQKRLAEILDLE